MFGTITSEVKGATLIKSKVTNPGPIKSFVYAYFLATYFPSRFICSSSKSNLRYSCDIFLCSVYEIGKLVFCKPDSTCLTTFCKLFDKSL